ncbi:hypothetical protein NUSPORA_01876 [Nucleospora cyclopteri]
MNQLKLFISNFKNTSFKDKYINRPTIYLLAIISYCFISTQLSFKNAQLLTIHEIFNNIATISCFIFVPCIKNFECYKYSKYLFSLFPLICYFMIQHQLLYKKYFLITEILFIFNLLIEYFCPGILLILSTVYSLLSIGLFASPVVYVFVAICLVVGLFLIYAFKSLYLLDTILYAGLITPILSLVTHFYFQKVLYPVKLTTTIIPQLIITPLLLGFLLKVTQSKPNQEEKLKLQIENK